MDQYRVALLGSPVEKVEWNADNLGKIQSLGFNAVQLNIAWGYRPWDEPLNLEDVVDSAGMPDGRWQRLPLLSSGKPADVARRWSDLRDRIALARQAGLHSIFHFGAPYNMHLKFGDQPPNCISDADTLQFHVELLTAFHAQYPGVDDLLLYTYDQDAWLCSEFGECPRCSGIPLHQRVAKFVNLLSATWGKLNPGGRVWWEPWELSAGQVFKSIPLLDAERVGLALHGNVAEVMATMPVDRWLEISVKTAAEWGIPVIIEHFLTSQTEEVEPFCHLPWPVTILKGLRKIHALEASGIKEYYGIVPRASDANLGMTSLFFKNPQIKEDEAMRILSQPYGEVSEEMVRLWTLASGAMDFFPWNASWWIREVGKAKPAHSMKAAFIRGQQAHTPSWESTRRTIFMKTDDLQPDPWMLEDVQLQCELCAQRIGECLELAESIRERVPPERQNGFALMVRDFGEWRRRTLSYVYHLRETNLAMILRGHLQKGKEAPVHVIEELREILRRDMENQGQSEPCFSALALLEKDPARFVETYFIETDESCWETFDDRFSVTSR
jgi:hypothetical protein